MNDGRHHYDRKLERELERQIERMQRRMEEKEREMERHMEAMRREVEDPVPRPEPPSRYPIIPGEYKVSRRPGSDFRSQQPKLGPASPPSSGTGTLNVNLLDQEEELVLTAAVPGFSKDEIDVSLVDDVIQIEATHEEAEEQEDEEGQYVMRELRRSMSRSVALGTPIAEDEEIVAQYENGVVTIRLPKAEPTEDEAVRQIDIE